MGAVARGIVIGAPLGFVIGGCIFGANGNKPMTLDSKDLKMKQWILGQAIND